MEQEPTRADPSRVEAAQAADLRSPFAVDVPQRAWVTNVLIGANVLVFVAMIASGVSLAMPEPADILAWGANYGPRVARGEWWRLLTCAFVHIGALHILFNMWSLRSLGLVVERLYGNGAFLLLYLLSAIGASITSALHNPSVPSAGASGAVFGVAGGLLAFYLLHRREMEPARFKQLMQSLLFIIGLNVMFGLSVPAIDNAAHLGGLATGLVGGVCLNRDVRGTSKLSVGRILRAALLAAVLLAAAALIPMRVRTARVRTASLPWTLHGADRLAQIESAHHR